MFHEDAFAAATPPLEAKRMLFSQYATEQVRCGKPLKLSFIDVRKAYFNAVPERDLYVRLPAELGMSKDYVAKLKKCMYGTRDAASLWENCYGDALKKMGFVQGVASPCCFYHSAWGVQCVVHGDDLTALGNADGLNAYEKAMQEAFECKLKGRLGGEDGDEKEMRVLNRIVRVTSRGLLYEPDPRHIELLIKAMDLEQANSQVTPCVKMTAQEEES